MGAMGAKHDPFPPSDILEVGLEFSNKKTMRTTFDWFIPWDEILKLKICK